MRESDSAALPAPRRRRPWLRILLASAAVLVVGFGVYVGSFLANYQPLSGEGAMSGVFPGKYLGEFTDPSGDPSFSVYRVRGEPGEPFEYSFTLHNVGPEAVTIERIVPPYADPGFATPVIYTGTRLAETAGPGRGSDLEVSRSRGVWFRPFNLGPDQFRAVEIENTFANCTWRGSDMMQFFGIQVTYRVFGVTRHTTITPGYSIEYAAGSCPINERGP